MLEMEKPHGYYAKVNVDRFRSKSLLHKIDSLHQNH